MMTRGVTGQLVALLVLAAIVGTAYWLHQLVNVGVPNRGEMTAMRFRETIDFTVEGIPREISFVQEVHVGIERATGVTSVITKSFGEAAAIDLGQDGQLFALLRYPYSNNEQMRTLLATACDFPAFKPTSEDKEQKLQSWIDQLDQVTGPCEVPPESWPLLVRFADSSRPDSVERVFPDELPALYAGRVAITGVTVERTDAPLTTGILADLPWLSEPFDRLVVEAAANESPERLLRINRSDFINMVPQ